MRFALNKIIGQIMTLQKAGHPSAEPQKVNGRFQMISINE